MHDTTRAATVGGTSLASPLFISDRNAEALIGRPWRWVRDTARSLGVPVLQGGRLVDAPAFERAIRERSARVRTPDGPDGVLAAIGRTAQ